MPDRFDLSYEVTREDWLAVNEACMRESPAWASARAQHRRAMRRQVLFTAPFCIVGAALFMGRSQSTHGMYAEGACLGACFATFLYFALPRVNTVEKAKRTQLEQIDRMDLTDHTGTTTIAMDEFGVQIHSPHRQLKLSWKVVAPTVAGGFVLLQYGGHDGTIIPARAFASEAAAAEFIDHAQRWWQIAQGPHAERLERYLADRDLACPSCKYNLRGMRGEVCPECGEPIKLDLLVAP